MTKNKDDQSEELMTEYFDEFTLLTQLQNQLNESLKSGYFLLSKSRYSMGLKSLGQIQYPEYMKPTFGLEIPKNGYNIENEDNHIVYHDNVNSNNSDVNGTTTSMSTTRRRNRVPNNNNDDDNHHHHSKHHHNKSTSSSSSSSSTSTKSPSSTSQSSSIGAIERLLNATELDSNGNLINKNNDVELNQQQQQQQQGDQDDDTSSSYSSSEDEDNEQEQDKDDTNTNNNNNNTTSTTTKKKRKDLKANPIYWFGYLTPPTLKQSQTNFKQALILSIEIANKLIKMETIQRRYMELQKQ